MSRMWSSQTKVWLQTPSLGVHDIRGFLAGCVNFVCPALTQETFCIHFLSQCWIQHQSSAWIYRRLCAARSHSRFLYRERDMIHTSFSQYTPAAACRTDASWIFSGRWPCFPFKISQINTLKILGVAIIIIWERAIGEALRGGPFFYHLIQQLTQDDSSFMLLCGCAAFRHGTLGLH